MNAPETIERRAGLKTQLIDRLHDPLQLRIFVVGIVILVGYGGVYMPLKERIDKTNRQIELEQRMQDLAVDLNRLEKQCRVFDKRLPINTDGKEWMQYVNEGILRFPLKLTKFNSLEPIPVGPYKAITLRIELEGTYFDLDQFLRWLETNPRLFRIDDFSIGLSKKPGVGRGAAGANDELVMQLTVLGLAG